MNKLSQVLELPTVACHTASDERYHADMAHRSVAQVLPNVEYFSLLIPQS